MLAALIDVYHDFLVRQISLIDQKEINLQRRARSCGDSGLSGETMV